MRFYVGDKSADLELCVFCERVKDLSRPDECAYYSEEYEGGSCSGFAKADDIAKRLSKALEASAMD